MRRRILLASLATLLPIQARAETVTLRARDGLAIEGELTRATAARRGIILLFHMAGSNRGEYTPIAPELARLGWDALAIDQRSGGPLWGRQNTTARKLRSEPDYIDALPDLEAALDFATTHAAGQPILALGSSYSAALVFLLAQAHPGRLAALLAFSPGEYLPGHSVRGAAAAFPGPVFVTSASDPSEIAASRAILAAAPSPRKRQFVPRTGTHGAGTLRQDTNPSGQTENWAALRDFLAGL